jgi:hypothetical protein
MEIDHPLLLAFSLIGMGSTHSKFTQAIPSCPNPAQPDVHAVSCSGVTGPIKKRTAR